MVFQINTSKVNKAIHCVAFVSLLLDINLIRTEYVKRGTGKNVEPFLFPDCFIVHYNVYC